jgi:hypothetical protein
MLQGFSAKLETKLEAVRWSLGNHVLMEGG